MTICKIKKLQFDFNIKKLKKRMYFQYVTDLIIFYLYYTQFIDIANNILYYTIQISNMIEAYLC